MGSVVHYISSFVSITALNDRLRYRFRLKMSEHDFDVFLQVFDWTAGVGHTGRHHKGVEDLPVLTALKKETNRSVHGNDTVCQSVLCFLM